MEERMVSAGRGWGSALLIAAMDIWGLPDSLKSAWHFITGG